MTSHEAKTQEERLVRFRALEQALGEARVLLDQIERGGPRGKMNDSPFTGNHRESRQVDAVRIVFSATRGGDVPVDMNLNGLRIEAWKLGQFLEEQLKERIKLIAAEMEKI